MKNFTVILQAYPPAINTLLLRHHLLESLERVKPSVVHRQHVNRHAWFSFFKYRCEVIHRQKSWLCHFVTRLSGLEEFSDEAQLS